jgi:uncharacterized protein YkwD
MKYHVDDRQGNQDSHKLKPLIGLSLLVTVLSPMSLSAAPWSTQEMLVFDLVNHQRDINNLNPLRRNDRLHDAALAHSQSMADNDFFSHTTLIGGNNEGPGDRIASTGYRFSVGGENIAAGHGRILSDPTEVMMPLDAARHVMYGTADLDEYNAFFSNPVDSWNEVGVGVSSEEWDDWHEYRLESSPCDYDGDGINDDQCNSDGGWMGSSGHRDAILDERFMDIGVGYVLELDDEAPILSDQGVIPFPLHTYWTQEFASPVPLPGAFWLLGSGLVGMIALGRRRRDA